MLSFLPPVLRGVIAFVLLVLNTLFWCALLFILALFKLILPFQGVRTFIDPWLNRIATAWISCNSGWMALTQRTRWDVQGVDKLPYQGWYLVNANHQSWVDIFALQHQLNLRIPMLKFFIKQQLIYVPVIGLAWWALDFPFMKRHSRDALRKNPGLRDQDRETTRKACEKFALVPTSIMNFAEGTRFTPEKHRRTSSPYRHLLKPKAGGIAMALNAMGDKFQAILDVTIVYPDGAPTFWHFLQGKLRHIVVRVRTLPVPQHLAHGDYAGDPAMREAFQQWVHQLWQEKDAQITALLSATPSATNPGRG